MAIFQCEARGSVEHLLLQPESCSLCSVSYPTLICGEIVQSHDEYDSAIWHERLAGDDRRKKGRINETFGAVYNRSIAALPEVPARLLSLGLLVVFSLFILAALPDGMSQCLEKHGFDACHTTLYR